MKLKKLIVAAFTATAMMMLMSVIGFAADSDYQFDIDSGTITKYQGSDSNVVIPSTIAGYPVKRIGKYAFQRSDIVSVVINTNITEIDVAAFDSCENLTNVTINSDKLVIGRAAFEGCINLVNLKISSNELKFSGKDYATYGYGDNGTFEGCASLKSVVLPHGTANIGRNMFWGCSSLESIYIPDTVKTIEKYSFFCCFALKSVSIPDSVNFIGDCAFEGCTSLKSLNIPSSVTGGEISYLVSDCTSLKSISLGSLSKIGAWSFKNTIIEEITMPVSVKSIDGGAFEGLKTIKKLTVLNDSAEVNFGSLSKDCVVYCGANSTSLKEAIKRGLKYVIINTASAAPVASNTAKVSLQKLSVDGKNVDIEAYNIGGNNYFKLRDIAYIMKGTKKQFNIAYDGKTNAISILKNTAYQADGSELKKNKAAEIFTKPSTSSLYFNNEKVNINAYNINGNNYFKLRDLASMLNFGINYNSATNSIAIISAEDYKA